LHESMSTHMSCVGMSTHVSCVGMSTQVSCERVYKGGFLLCIVVFSFSLMQPLVILLESFAILSILRIKISAPAVDGGHSLSGRPFPFPSSDL